MRLIELKTGIAVLCTALTTFTATAEPPRAARSVHLLYPAPEVTAFYLELTVQKSVPGSYFMACGFSHGYFGIQEQSSGKKVVIFSVWDPSKGDDANAVPLEQRVEIPFNADDVVVRRFGGEGTGGQSFYEFDWKPGEVYRFMVRSTVTGKKTAFAAYFRAPGSKAWKHLATFRTSTGGDNLTGLYSFIEDFRRDTKSANETRRAAFGNGWVQITGGKWQPLTKAVFSASGSEWEARDAICAGVASGRFYLQTGGNTVMASPIGTQFNLPPAKRAPSGLE
ncbi:MAG TPA: DUF3472 domain-containing protein [Armatimonadota bacterium]|jgi:hypothetical protein